jgi:hypothetical protein
MDDTVGINVEGNLDLGYTSWCRWDTGEIELSKQFIVNNHLSLSLEDTDGDHCLIVSSGGIDSGLFGWDGGISFNHSGHNTT